MVKLKGIYTAHISTSHITKHKSKNLCFASQLIYVRHRWYSDTHFFLTNALLKFHGLFFLFHLHRLFLPFSFLTLLLSLNVALSLYIYTYTYIYPSLLQTMSQIKYIYVYIYAQFSCFLSHFLTFLLS